MIEPQEKLAQLIKMSISPSKLTLCKFDIFFLQTVFSRADSNDKCLIMSLESFLNIKGQPSLTDVINSHTLSQIKSDADYCTAVSMTLSKANLKQ